MIGTIQDSLGPERADHVRGGGRITIRGGIEGYLKKLADFGTPAFAYVRYVLEFSS